MSRHQAYIGLGSNLGDRASNLSRSLARLEGDPQIVLRRVSAVYQSAPCGPVRAQPDFFNAVAEVCTTLAPRQLLRRCQQVEQQLGRRREVHQGPRSIDLDLLLFGALVERWPDLELPHAALADRAFVLAPLLELAPGLVDPRNDEPLAGRIGAVRHQRLRRLGPLALVVAAEPGRDTTAVSGRAPSFAGAVQASPGMGRPQCG